MTIQENIPYTADEIKAMVKTCEKYNKARDMAKKIYNSEFKPDEAAVLAKYLPMLFPEIKESEDERIRKTLIDLVKCNERSGYKLLNNVSTDSMIAWLEKQGKKPQVGDWVVKQDGESFWNGDYAAQITDITDRGEHWLNIDCWVEAGDIRLWTIEDAKDGDVLVCDINKAEIGGNVEKLPNITPTICIYQNVVKDKDYIHTYCSLYNESSLIVSNSMYYNTFVYNIHPATKEQRDLFFSKMKEAGYEWDSENKEVKKIEVASKEGEDEQMIERLKSCVYASDLTTEGRNELIAWLEKQTNKD